MGRLRYVLAAALLAAPTALAFFSGGFFSKPRLWAAILVWLGVAAAAIALPLRLPRSRPALVCLAGLAGLTAWVALSIVWTPVRDPALGDAERLLLYLGFVVCGAIVLRGPVVRAVEPALAGGTVIVAAYALATRFMPGIVPSHHGVRAADRLDQPLTYWNAVGALAAVGLVLSLRLASDPSRDRRLRTAGAAVTPGLALALYLTLSRGALAAAAVGIVLLVVLERDRAALRTVAATLAGAVLAVALVTRFPEVNRADGAGAAQGVAALALLVAISVGLAVLERRLLSAGPGPRLRLSRAGAGLAALAAAGLVAAALVAPSLGDSQHAGPNGKRGELPLDSRRLRTLKTNRIKYWRVALHGFADQPIRGVGTRGFATLWLERRTISESAVDAHSIEIETLVELGLVGVLLLAAFLGGAVALLARQLRAGPAVRSAAVGSAAVASVFLVHSAVDWDWEMPALALIFLALVAAGIGASDLEPA